MSDEREALVRFLDQVHEAKDPIALCDRLRREGAAPTRKKPRFQIPRECEPGDFDSLPATLKLTRGHLELDFQTLDELGESLFAVAACSWETRENSVEHLNPTPCREQKRQRSTRWSFSMPNLKK